MRLSALVPALFVLACGASTAVAQEISGGVKAGVNFANFKIDPEDDDMDFDRRTGLIAGAFLVVPVSPQFAIQPEALFSMKGVTIPRIEDGDSDAEGRIKLDYLDVPVLARFSSPSTTGTSLHVFAGPSFNFRLSAKSGLEVNGESDDDDISDQIERFELALVVGGGVEFGRLLIDGRYAWGLSNVNKDNQDDMKIKNRVFSVMAGVRF
jgi:hypothetical protein